MKPPTVTPPTPRTSSYNAEITGEISWICYLGFPQTDRVKNPSLHLFLLLCFPQNLGQQDGKGKLLLSPIFHLLFDPLLFLNPFCYFPLMDSNCRGEF